MSLSRESGEHVVPAFQDCQACRARKWPAAGQDALSVHMRVRRGVVEYEIVPTQRHERGVFGLVLGWRV